MVYASAPMLLKIRVKAVLFAGSEGNEQAEIGLRREKCVLSLLSGSQPDAVAGIQTERSDRSSFRRIGRGASKGESGQVIVQAALSMTILLGFLAFVTDVGLLLRQKRIIQTAADSAAVAGAAELSNGLTAARAAALADASQNGVTNGSDGVTITVNNPPSSGPNANSASKALYVEVIISKPQQTFFMNAFHISSLTVDARAVAKAVAANACLWALSTAAGKGVDVGGTTQLSLPNCGIVDNATGSTALNVGGSAQLSAKFVDVSGTVSGSNISNTTSVTTGMTAQSDPLASKVSPPTNPGGCTSLNVTSNQTIGPTSGNSICYSSLSVQSGATAILNPGIYYINGNLSVSGGASLQGTGGVTFYITNGGAVSISGGATMNLTAPSGGVLFYQDPADTSKFKFSGGTAGTINGIFYLPGAELDLNGGAGQTLNVDLVVGTLNVTGNSFINSYVPLTGASSLSDPVLTE